MEPLSQKTKLLTAAAIFFGNIGLAVVCHVHGPALTSFQKKYSTDDATISIVFSLMTAGVAMGSLLSGFLFRLINRQLATIFVFGWMGVCMFLIPFCSNIVTFFVVSGLMGLFGGFYAAAQFTWMLEMMESKCAPYVIAEHFFYALGIILSSLILAPFLDKGDEIATNKGMTGNESLEVTQQSSDHSHDFHLFIPFAIFAVFLEMAMVFQLYLYQHHRYRSPQKKKEDVNDNNTVTEDEENKTSKGRESNNCLWTKMTRNSFIKRFLLIVYLGVFCGSFKGMEDNVVAFLPKYAQNGPFHMSESDSAYLLSASMLSYTVSRFFGIFVVYKVPPRGLLCFNMGLTIVCNYLLMTHAYTSQTVLWVTAVLFGVAFSTAYGCFSAYLERYLRVTDGVGAWVLLFGSGIAAVYPIFIGHYIDKNPIVLAYTTWVSIGICSFVFFVSSVQTYFDRKKY